MSATSRLILALKVELRIAGTCDISCSFPTATVALSWGAGLSSSLQSYFPCSPWSGVTYVSRSCEVQLVHSGRSVTQANSLATSR